MKKIYYMTVVLVIMLLQACTNETEPLFNKSASERMSEVLAKYKELLISNPNGWLVEYYPQESREYGGYDLFFKFEGENATVKSEVKSPLITVDESTSFYSLGEDMGPTLNFNTYNEILNFFSDPALNVGGGAGFGYEGDYEFVFMSGDASEIILRGKKTKNTIRLTPFPSTTTWQEYCDDVQAIKDAFSAPSYSMTVNGKAVTSITKPSAAYNRFIISYEEDKEAVSSKMAYVVSSTGIRFYEPLTIDGVTMQEFTFNKTSEQMESADGKVVISLVFPPVEDIFVNSLSSSRWYMSSADMGSGFSTSFETVKSQITSRIGEQLAYSWIGASISTNTPSFSFGSYDGSRVWYGSILFDVTKVEGQEAQIKIVVNGTSEVNGSYYISQAPELGTFINSLEGIYNITTTDSPRSISSVTLTDPADSNRRLTLTLAEVEFP